MSASNEIIDADAPFNDPSADFILRTSESIDFRVHKFILSMASPIFQSMFTLPSPSSTETQEVKEGLPVLICPESSKTFDTVLRLCYPTTVPTLTKLADLIPDSFILPSTNTPWSPF